jgi:hypothetical protein
MQLISSSWGAQRASIFKGFIGGHALKASGKKIKLPDDIAESLISMQRSKMTG